MTLIDWMGFIGVLQILLAYVLNVTQKCSNKSFIFIILNFSGATMACIASILLNYWPFIMLEGIWALVALYSLLRYKNT